MLFLSRRRWPRCGIRSYDSDDTANRMELNGLLVISQTERVHQKIESFYTKLRKTIPNAAKKPLEKPADDELRMAVYSVPATYTGFTAEERINPSEREVLKLITSVVEPASWRKRGDVYAHSIKDRLIIRHTNAVHRKIRELGLDRPILRFDPPYANPVTPVVGDK